MPASDGDMDLDTLVKTTPKFDDDPHRLLLRSIALALEHVGFEGASPEALEAFCAEAETC